MAQKAALQYMMTIDHQLPPLLLNLFIQDEGRLSKVSILQYLYHDKFAPQCRLLPVGRVSEHPERPLDTLPVWAGDQL